MNYADIPVERLREVAREVIHPKDPARHWTVLSELIGAVDDRRAWEEWDFRSLRAWAEGELDLSGADVLEAVKLWTLVKASGLPLAQWAEVSKGKALVVARALALGGDAARWVALALEAASADDLRDELRRQIGEDVWTEWSIALPEGTARLVEAAMLLALREVRPDITDLGVAKAAVANREVAHQLLERIVGDYVQSHGGVRA